MAEYPFPAGQISELGRLHAPGRRHGSPPPRVLPGGLLRGAAALAGAEHADGAGCSAHGGARHEAPRLLPEGLAVRGRPAEAVRVQVGRCRDEPTLDRAASPRCCIRSSAHLTRTHRAAFVPAGGPPSPPPPPSQLQPRPSQRTPVQPSGRPAHGHSQPSPPAHAMVVAPHIPARQRTRERRPCRASALLPPSSPRFERTHAGRVVRAGRTRTSTRRSSTTARASSSAPPPPRRRAWRPPPPTAANPLPNT